MGRNARIGQRPPSRGPSDAELAKMPKRRIEIRQVKTKIPEELFNKFVRDSGNIPNEEIEAARNAKIRFVAFHGREAVGFFCADPIPKEKAWAGRGAFVKERYRRQGIMPSLIEKAGEMGIRRGFRELRFNNISMSAAITLNKLREKKEFGGEIKLEKRFNRIPQNALIRFAAKKRSQRRR